MGSNTSKSNGRRPANARLTGVSVSTRASMLHCHTGSGLEIVSVAAAAAKNRSPGLAKTKVLRLRSNHPERDGAVLVVVLNRIALIGFEGGLTLISR
jgi:hypothetical protein